MRAGAMAFISTREANEWSQPEGHEGQKREPAAQQEYGQR
jgi:hypothetical protein